MLTKQLKKIVKVESNGEVQKKNRREEKPKSGVYKIERRIYDALKSLDDFVQEEIQADTLEVED